MVAGEVLVAVVAQYVSLQVILVHVTATVVAHRDIVRLVETTSKLFPKSLFLFFTPRQREF